MTEPYGYDENDQNDTSDDSDRSVTLKRSQIKSLERDAKEARQAREQLAQMQRENTLYKSGLGSLTERQQKALFASIDGDVTAETVRATAEELGFVQPAADSPKDEERQAMEQMSQASAGATDPGSEDSISRLHRVAREGGKDALLAQIQADGHTIVASG